MEDWNKVIPPKYQNERISLIADATYFGREYGFLCFSDGKRIIYAVEIETENKEIFSQSLRKIKEAGYKLHCLVIDGKRGMIEATHDVCKGLPIQMCHFHMKRIIRRHLGDKSSDFIISKIIGLMDKLTSAKPQDFIDEIGKIEAEHLMIKKSFGISAGEKKINSALKSLSYFLPHLFTFKQYPYANIPNTTNFLEGGFSHLKEKLNLHRGLKEHRKKHAIKFLLHNHNFNSLSQI